MDSEDEMQNARGGMSEGGFFHTNEDEHDGSEYSVDTNGDNDEFEHRIATDGSAMSDLVLASHLPQSSYTILSEKDIGRRQEEAGSTITNFLSVSRIEAGILLRYFSWSVSKVTDEWFADEERVRARVGLVLRLHVEKRIRISFAEELTCEICFERHLLERMKAEPTCGHFFCDTCWTSYIHTAINDGPGCLALRCPDPACGAAIREDMVFILVGPEDGAKYARYMLRSFVENNRTVKWCPSPGCEYAIDFVPGSGSFDVVCKCSHNFCWNCLEEAHHPVDCDTVAKWILKNTSDSDNLHWILEYSKPCPKCKRPIEKIEGCMRITCIPPCEFTFCWLCLGAMGTPDSFVDDGIEKFSFDFWDRISGQHDCVYDEETEVRREMAKRSLESFTHYTERWLTHESSRAKALSDIQRLQAVEKKLSRDQCRALYQLRLLSEAFLQVVQCRRVLKWTYAYGYYLPDNQEPKRQFFEFVQGEAEAQLERLHQFAEKDLQRFLDAVGASPPNPQDNFEKETPEYSFSQSRAKLAGFKSANATCFENLVRAIENGLADVDISRAKKKKAAVG